MKNRFPLLKAYLGQGRPKHLYTIVHFTLQMVFIMDSKQLRILRFFLDNPTREIHLRSLSRILKISPTWISTLLPKFKDLLSVHKDTERTMVLIKANRDSLAFKRLKQSQNLYKLSESGIIDLLIEKYHKPEAMVLFGSYAKGEDIEQSDIDLAVITSRSENIVLTHFEKKLKRKIKIIELKKELIESEFKNTLANGVVLYGYLDVIQ